MKTDKTSKGSVTEPLLQDLMSRHKAEWEQSLRDASIGSAPLDPSDLYQDDGGGYNPDFTFPQQ